MSRSFIYPDMMSELLDACEKKLSGLVSNDELQRVVQRAEHTIVAVEEKYIRNHLTGIEGELELIKFTVEEAEQASAGRKVASDLINWIEARAAAQSAGSGST